MNHYAQVMPENKSAGTHLTANDVDGLRFKHAFRDLRLQHFDSMDKYMEGEGIPKGIEVLEGSGGLGGKNTALYTHVIGPDNYKYSRLFEVVAGFFEPKNGKPVVIFLPHESAPPSTLQPGVSAPEGTWSLPADSTNPYIPINPIIWHGGVRHPRFTVHSSELLSLWSTDILNGLESARKGVLEVAEAFGLETTEKTTFELLDEIKTRVFQVIRSEPGKKDDAMLVRQEDFVREATNKTIAQACSVLSGFEEILKDNKVRKAFPEDIDLKLSAHMSSLKPSEIGTKLTY